MDRTVTINNGILMVGDNSIAEAKMKDNYIHIFDVSDDKKEELVDVINNLMYSYIGVSVSKKISSVVMTEIINKLGSPDIENDEYVVYNSIKENTLYDDLLSKRYHKRSLYGRYI